MNTNTIWKDIAGYEGMYQISTDGQVLSLNYRNSGKTQLLKQATAATGYKTVMLSKDGKQRTLFVHRLVMLTFKPIDNPNDYQIDHKDNRRDNNKIENLRWLCRKDNNSRLHARRMRSKNSSKNTHNEQFILGTKDGETRYFINQADAANHIGCSKVLVTKALSEKD